MKHYVFVGSAGAYNANSVEPMHVEGDKRKSSAGGRGARCALAMLCTLCVLCMLHITRCASTLCPLCCAAPYAKILLLILQ